MLLSALAVCPALARAAAPGKAYGFSLKGVDGKTYSLSEFRGKVVLLNFWATWCGECVKEIPSLERLEARMKGQAFTVLSVSVDDSEEALDKFLRKTPLPYPVLRDPERKVAFDLYAVFGLPASFLIDKNGNLVERIYGSRDWDSADTVGLIEGLIKR
ncbi:MAG: TlpA disulfide reductase family protein [Nitrospiraceae bacterium]|nr:TlpA disulfide reductase family protein [Nitrospiraceae bacterium]